MRGFFYHLGKKSELYFVVPLSERKFSVSQKIIHSYLRFYAHRTSSTPLLLQG